jgi:hypothetical protein
MTLYVNLMKMWNISDMVALWCNGRKSNFWVCAHQVYLCMSSIKCYETEENGSCVIVHAWTGSYGDLETDHCGRWHPYSGTH